jgi:hypothetical protein
VVDPKVPFDVSYTFETVSTTWVGACGVGDWLRNPTAANPCQQNATRAYELAKATDLMTYTYYPEWVLGSAPTAECQHEFSHRPNGTLDRVTDAKGISSAPRSR